MILGVIGLTLLLLTNFGNCEIITLLRYIKAILDNTICSGIICQALVNGFQNILACRVRDRLRTPIQAAVITAAGLGTRMLPFSKEIPKEMMPLIVKSANGIVVVPVLHYIFDSLYEAGFRRFYFVVGRGKRVIEDYFTPDWSYVDFLQRNGKDYLAKILTDFYEKVEKCDIVMINQPSPRGFGDAVLRTKPFMTEEVFLVHAGDDIIYPNHTVNLERLVSHYLKYRPKAAFLYDTSVTPEKYGVIIGSSRGDFIEVEDVIEKPSKPPSNKVIIAIYVFDQGIYDALERTRPAKGEHQLTNAIRYLIKRGEKVHAVRVAGRRLDLGTPDQYLRALRVMVEEVEGV